MCVDIYNKISLDIKLIHFGLFTANLYMQLNENNCYDINEMNFQ